MELRKEAARENTNPVRSGNGHIVNGEQREYTENSFTITVSRTPIE